MSVTTLPPAPLLYVDTASAVVHVGLQVAGATTGIPWRTSTDEAGVGLFREADRLFQDNSIGVVDLRAVVFCEGPGSLLGIRLAAMALRTWTVLAPSAPPPVYAYRSLELIAADLLASGTEPPFVVVSDARRETWNTLDVDADGKWSEIERRKSEALVGDRPIYSSTDFPHWQVLPSETCMTAYRPVRLPELAQQFPLLRHTTSPDAFMVEQPAYRPWNPKANPAAR